MLMAAAACVNLASYENHVGIGQGRFIESGTYLLHNFLRSLAMRLYLNAGAGQGELALLLCLQRQVAA